MQIYVTDVAIKMHDTIGKQDSVHLEATFLQLDILAENVGLHGSYLCGPYLCIERDCAF